MENPEIERHFYLHMGSRDWRGPGYSSERVPDQYQDTLNRIGHLGLPYCPAEVVEEEYEVSVDQYLEDLLTDPQPDFGQGIPPSFALSDKGVWYYVWGDGNQYTKEVPAEHQQELADILAATEKV